MQSLKHLFKGSSSKDPAPSERRPSLEPSAPASPALTPDLEGLALRRMQDSAMARWSNPGSMDGSSGAHAVVDIDARPARFPKRVRAKISETSSHTTRGRTSVAEPSSPPTRSSSRHRSRSRRSRRTNPRQTQSFDTTVTDKKSVSLLDTPSIRRNRTSGQVSRKAPRSSESATRQQAPRKMGDSSSSGSDRRTRTSPRSPMKDSSSSRPRAPRRSRPDASSSEPRERSLSVKRRSSPDDKKKKSKRSAATTGSSTRTSEGRTRRAGRSSNGSKTSKEAEEKEAATSDRQSSGSKGPSRAPCVPVRGPKRNHVMSHAA